MCGLPFAVSLALTMPLQAPAPICPRTDTPVTAALLGDSRGAPAVTDPQFEAAIRAIRQPAPRSTRRRR